MREVLPFVVVDSMIVSVGYRALLTPSFSGISGAGRLLMSCGYVVGHLPLEPQQLRQQLQQQQLLLLLQLLPLLLLLRLLLLLSRRGLLLLLPEACGGGASRHCIRT